MPLQKHRRRRQTPHAVGGEENGENQVPLGKQAAWQRGGPARMADLYQPEWLEGDTTAIQFWLPKMLAEQYVEGQQLLTRCGYQRPPESTPAADSEALRLISRYSSLLPSTTAWGVGGGMAKPTVVARQLPGIFRKLTEPVRRRKDPRQRYSWLTGSRCNTAGSGSPAVVTGKRIAEHQHLKQGRGSHSVLGGGRRDRPDGQAGRGKK